MTDGCTDAEACLQLERLFLRLASINDDPKLEQYAHGSLMQIICTISSGGPTVHSKGMELLSHLNRRIKGNTNITLPFDDLAVFLGTNCSQRNAIATNFAMVYLKMAVRRLNEDDHSRALPLLLKALNANIDDNNIVHQLLLLTTGGWVRLSQMNFEKWPNLEQLSDTRIRAFILQYFTDILAFPYPSGKLEASVALVEAHQMYSLSCISVNTYLRIAKDLFLSTSFSVTTVKVAVLKVLSSAHFKDVDILPLLPLALASGCNEVEFAADAAMKKVDVGEALKEKQVVDKLFSFYLGSASKVKVAVLKVLSSAHFKDVDILPLLPLALASGCNEVEFAADAAMKKVDVGEALKEKQVVDKLFSFYLGSASKDTPKEDQVPHASVRLKLRIMPLLIRSSIAPTIFPLNVKVAFDGLFGGVDVPHSQKLQQLAAEFLLLLVKNCPPNFMPTFGPIIFSSLRKLIDNCEYTNVVALGYQCFGIIGRNVPKLITKDMALVQETFDAIPKAPDDVSASIIDCLVTWLPTFCALNDAASAGVLQTLISSYIQHDSPKCRLVALKYVEALVKSPALEFRWMLCQACGDARDEIRREACRLLELSVSQKQFMPAFEDMTEYLHKKLKLDNEAAKVVETGPDGVKKKKEMFPDEVFQIVAEYVFACACVSSGHAAILRPEKDESSTQLFPDIYAFLTGVLERRPEAISAFLDIVLQAIEVNPLIHLLDIAIILLNCNGGKIKESSRERVVGVLRQYLNSSARASICSSVANMFVVALSESERNTLLSENLAALENNPNVLPSAGWICAYVTCIRSDSMNARRIDDVQKRLVAVMKANSAQPNALLESSCAALCESLRRSPIALGTTCAVELYNLRSDEWFTTVAEQMGKLAKSRKDTVTTRLKEAAAGCLGFLSSLNLQLALYEKIISELFSIGEGSPQPELQFTVGDALFDAAFGEQSPSRRNTFAESEKTFLDAFGEERRDVVERRLSSLLDVIMGAKLIHTNRHLRQSALIWLFVLTKRGAAADLIVIAQRLSQIQLAFINALAESNDFSQDVASKGLGVVFELGNETQKKAMMNELVNALSSGRRMVTSITADTPVFESGEMGKAPGGENLTTYQELCSLATDLNQPELMYRFMQLANHNALWNSKKGAAFGFNVVLQQARTDLEPFLAQIVPKLFRYRYDPDLRVQQSMRTIWHTLTSSKKNVVEEYADLIFAELLITLSSSLWRTRESSCLALSDLLSTNCTTNMHERFGELFGILFRVQDDVKESVRLAANRALSSLIKVSIRECSSDRGEKATRLIGALLPALIEKGMRSVVKANRMFSLKAVMDLSKEAGAALQPHLVAVVPCLLESLSETEPTVLSYLAARSESEELEALDTARTSAARISPMMQTLHDVIPLISEQVLSDLAPRLCELLRASVGLTTRTGACQFVINVCLRRQQILLGSRHVCDKLMQALFSGLRDRNPTVRKQFASAISYLLKFCSDGQTETLLKFVREKLEGDQEEDKTTALHVLRSLAANNNEFLSSCATSLIPHVFLATCQQVEKGDEAAKKKQEMWDELWSEMITETSSTIRLHRKEMMELAVCTLKENPVWAMKAQAAIMLAKIVDAVAEDIEPSDADEIYSTLISVLTGRLWDGKVKVIQAVTVLLQSAGEKLAAEWSKSSTIEQKFAPIWKECKKKDRTYSAEAIICASVFCEKMHDVTDATELFALIKHIIAVGGQQSSDSEDSEGDKANNIGKVAARNAHIVRVVSALPRTLLAFDFGVEVICGVLESSTVYWKVKQALVVELPHLLERWRFEGVFDMSTQFMAVACLLLDNANQRRSFAQQCCVVLERITEGALSGRWRLVTTTISDLTSKLMNSEVVDSSLTFGPLLRRLVE
ncbi:Proteasome-associated protein ECM29 -like protein [Toxocara canis]|uniref:Proteasome-associated protein ECM29-like protein n=1 Tax=Toxocara canis TaxID=6265 RepID=A0A0B2VUJ2_TOXCA|nr:Proteasome-associated protein ECM29 -like protein [Toxocara canis]